MGTPNEVAFFQTGLNELPIDVQMKFLTTFWGTEQNLQTTCRPGGPGRSMHHFRWVQAERPRRSAASNQKHGGVRGLPRIKDKGGLPRAVRPC